MQKPFKSPAYWLAQFTRLGVFASLQYTQES